MFGCRATRGEQRALDLAAGDVLAVHDAARGVAALAAEVEVRRRRRGRSGTPSRRASAGSRPGPRATHELDDVAVAQAVADARACRRRAASSESSAASTAATPPCAQLVLVSSGALLGDDHHAAVLGGAQREVQAGDPGADDQVVGLDQEALYQLTPRTANRASVLRSTDRMRRAGPMFLVAAAWPSRCPPRPGPSGSASGPTGSSSSPTRGRRGRGGRSCSRRARQGGGDARGDRHRATARYPRRRATRASTATSVTARPSTASRRRSCAPS